MAYRFCPCGLFGEWLPWWVKFKGSVILSRAAAKNLGFVPENVRFFAPYRSLRMTCYEYYPLNEPLPFFA